MISPETVSRVREHTDLVALVSKTVRLTRRGRSFVGLCPFHNEKSPSFHVNPDRGFFHCFGCKEGGSAIDFIMRIEGLPFPEAVRQLAEAAGIEIQESARVRFPEDDDREALLRINELAALFFEGQLRGHESAPPHPNAGFAHDELARRGLHIGEPGDSDEERQMQAALQAFRMGYAPHGWDGLVAHLTAQGLSLELAERLGLVARRQSGSGFYDRFRHRLMFAVTDIAGRVIAFSGRALPDVGPAEEGRDPPAKYINSPESPIYKKGEHLFGLYQARHEIRRTGVAMLVEGNFDVVSLHARGISTAVAPLGTAFTPAQAKLLRRFCQQVTLAFDSDGAGRAATLKSRAPLRDAGISGRVMTFPAGQDPDAFIQSAGREAFVAQAGRAKGLLEFALDDILAGFAGLPLTEQSGRIRQVGQLLNEEQDPTLRDLAKHYADRVAQAVSIQGASPQNLRHLESMLGQALAPSGPSSPRAVNRHDAKSMAQPDQVILAAVGALMDFPELLDDPSITGRLGLVDGPAALVIAALQRDGATPTALEQVFEGLDPAARSNLQARLAAPAHETIEAAKAEAMENFNRIEALSMRHAKVEALEAAKRGAGPEDEDALLRAAQERARRKHGIGGKTP